MKKIFSIAVLTFVPLLTMCSCPNHTMMGGWDNTGNYGCRFGFGGGMFMGLLFLIVLGVAIYFAVQYWRSTKTAGQAQETPIEILKKRYAKGEVTKEEFDRMKNDLQ